MIPREDPPETMRPLPAFATVGPVRIASILLVLFALFAIAPKVDGRTDVRPARFAVATDNLPSSRAAIEVMKAGGSFVDAAVAAATTLGVTQPSATGIGGGGFALVWDAKKKKAYSFDFRESAPKAYDIQGFIEGTQGSKIGVPGEIAGLAMLHERWGKRNFADNFAPAIRAAEEGFEITPHLVRAFGFREERVLQTPAYAAIFAPGGVLASAGTRVKNPALGKTLRRIGAEGPKAFYEGPIAEEMVEVAREVGSQMSLEDLRDYRVIEREPLRGSWEGYEIATMPSPSAGGVMLLQTLGIYSKAELQAMGDFTADYQHMVAEAMRGSIADRFRTMGDPAFVEDRTSELLTPEHLKARRARIARERTHAAMRFHFPEEGTTHFTIADSEGNVISLTSTVNSPFGGVTLAPKSGILLNDELSDFTHPELAKKLGLADGGPNAPRPLARPVSSMTPTIILRDNEPVLGVGGSGGMRIAGNVTQAVLYHLVFGKSAEDAVSAPRFFTPPTGPILSYAKDQLPPLSVQRDLHERGEQIQSMPFDFTGVQMVTLRKLSGGRRALEAGADPRKGSVGLVEYVN